MKIEFDLFEGIFLLLVVSLFLLRDVLCGPGGAGLLRAATQYYTAKAQKKEAEASGVTEEVHYSDSEIESASEYESEDRARTRFEGH